MKKFLLSKFTAYNVFLGLAFSLVFFSILAPILLKIGLEEPAKIIYFIYSFFCHQIDYRSLHIFDYQFAWCTRDTFIWTSIFIGGVIVKIFKIKPLKWFYLILASLPMALDGGIQLIATIGAIDDANKLFYASTNFSRMATGTILGLSLALWIFPTIQSFDINNEKRRKDLKTYYAWILGFILSFLIYLIFITLWWVTSTSYKPANIIDWKNRFPQDNSEWLIRRKHAICPVDGGDGNFISFRCSNN